MSSLSVMKAPLKFRVNTGKWRGRIKTEGGMYFYRAACGIASMPSNRSAYREITEQEYDECVRFYNLERAGR